MNSDTTLQEWHPVVGASAVPSMAAEPYHERWFVLDSRNIALASDQPALANVAVELKFGFLVLRAPGMLRLDIPLDVLEDDVSVQSRVQFQGAEVTVADEGAWAAEWFSQVLGQPVRLVKVCEPE